MSETVTHGCCDEAARSRFCNEIDRNFSVIAPAGVGKTRALVDRIVSMALAEACNPAAALLSKLVVVTYTRKAADEIRERGRQAIIASGATSIMARFNQIFLGTIHRFCQTLLGQYGMVLGLPQPLDLVEDDAALWREFVRQSDELAVALPEAVRKPFLCHMPLRSIAALARTLRWDTVFSPDCLPLYPDLNFEPLLSYSPSKSVRATVEEGQKCIRRWLAEQQAGVDWLPLPSYSKGGKAFLDLWKAAFQPLRDWLGETSAALIVELAKTYQSFRLNKGCVTYDDMIALTSRLLRDPHVGPQIRAQGWRVLLDEAQDTDIQQFDVLIELTRPKEAEGSWLKGQGPSPEPGRFCMVGDPQQAIYSNRADLPTYQRVHEQLVADGAAEALYFQVTFRCDQNIVDGINHGFPSVLRSSQLKNPVEFVPLRARAGAGEGQIVRLPLSPPSGHLERSSEAAEAEARAFAAWFRTLSLDALRADDWTQVAILCPRNDWLATLVSEIRTSHCYQLHSQGNRRGDHPAYAWLTALLVVITQPENAFEIVGVLREIFGLSDHDLAHWVRRWRAAPEDFPDALHAFQIRYPLQRSGAVADALNCLVQARAAVRRLPLRDAVWRLVETVRLRERLAVLPASPPDALSNRLDELLAQTTEAEQQGFSLEAWAHRLEQHFGGQPEATVALPGHVQLYSCHRAKGLEWQAVILPYLHRPISYPIERYPCLLDPYPLARARIKIDAQHDLREEKDKLDLKRQHELERLLYVAMTRARHTLVLIDDAAFFKRRERSFAHLFKILPGQENADYWEALPRSPSSEQRQMSLPRESIEAFAPEPFDPDRILLARQRADDFIRRALPSTLMHRDGSLYKDPAREPRSGLAEGFAAIGTSSRNYGNWWHEMMETTPWSEPPERWQQHWMRCRAGCPQSERGEKEINRFLASSLAQHLARDDLQIKTEVPFLWQDPSGIAYDGVLDLIAYDKKQGWIVDWKTDQNTPPAALRVLYGNQLAVYVKAVSRQLQQPVNGLLYATSLGLSIHIDIQSIP